VRFTFGEDFATPGSLTLNFADLTGSQLLPATGNASYGQVNVSNSLIQGSPTYSYLWYNEAGSAFTRNALVDHSLSIGTSETFFVTENLFVDTFASTGSAVSDWAAYGPAVQVVGNTFQLLGRVALELPDGYTSTAINAPGNYFGTTNADSIAGLILDRTDSLSRASVIAVSPVLSSSADNAPYWGTDTSGTWQGGTDANRAWGNGGNDWLKGQGGDDRIDGGAGIDTAVFSGFRSNYLIKVDSDGSVSVLDQMGTDGTDTLINVERLQFADSKAAVDVEGHGGQAYRLYQAAFNRTPDIAGLGYQMNALDNGLSISQVAANFIASPEFQATYGALDTTQFVTQLYANVLHRSPDSGGLAFHVSNLNAGMARADVLVGFSESPENQMALIGVIQTGMVYTL
jgi:hypothetical protein